ncbi:hypothetical protein SIL78_03730 [Halomonas alkaliphila]|uniref:Uncharacterized protein n=1 Tax=Vreelandella alkaliphila TaxID=272774 RepID=A0AAJ2RUF3_9GAMM|nr:hypothetical protein [Halomonas alkaliphila]MDX5976669.1 hypothetical protein [Halomonas alkaliphila]
MFLARFVTPRYKRIECTGFVARRKRQRTRVVELGVAGFGAVERCSAVFHVGLPLRVPHWLVPREIRYTALQAY